MAPDQPIISSSLSLVTISWNGVKSRWPDSDKGLYSFWFILAPICVISTVLSTFLSSAKKKKNNYPPIQTLNQGSSKSIFFGCEIPFSIWQVKFKCKHLAQLPYITNDSFTMDALKSSFSIQFVNTISTFKHKCPIKLPAMRNDNNSIIF